MKTAYSFLLIEKVETDRKQRVEKWRAQIASAVGNDATLDSTEWEIMVDSLLNVIPLIRNNLKIMIDTLIVY